jgi:glycerol-3-phosphate dehydrogenase (NAD(P)+)
MNNPDQTPEIDLTQPVAVLGAGAWGTTLAWLLAGKGFPVRLWARRPEFADELSATRENRTYLPGLLLPPSVTVTGDLAEALAEVSRVLVVTPSHGLRAVAEQAASLLAPGALVICATKGLERPSGKRMSEVLTETWGHRQPRLVALSGPNLSAEIAAGMPAVSVAASLEEAAACETQCLLSNNLFRLYTNSDIIGVELCGALKNIMAIGAGIVDGLGFGSNAKAALLTRGLAEMQRLGLKLGARTATFAGVAGIGDLLATCNSPRSRNYTVGRRLAEGEQPEEISRSLHSVAEGIFTTAAAREMAAAQAVETPITENIYRVLFAGLAPQEAVCSLMTRRWRTEEE